MLRVESAGAAPPGSFRRQSEFGKIFSVSSSLKYCHFFLCVKECLFLTLFINNICLFNSLTVIYCATTEILRT